MHLPGARQMGLARKFLETLPWNQIEPLPVQTGRLEQLLQHRPRLRRVLHTLGWPQAQRAPVAMGVARDKQLAIAYTVSDRSFGVDLSLFNGPVTATWIDPTHFDEHPARFDVCGHQMHVKPDRQNAAGESDWLLLLRPAA